MIYLAFYKPYGVLAEFTDPAGRPTLRDYIPIRGLSEVGRLDFDSEGLMLLTDDGLLGHRLAHPKYHQPKTYLAQVEGVPSQEALAALRRGVPIKGGVSRPAEIELLAEAPALPPRSAPIRERTAAPTVWLRMVLHEGRKREIRHMTAAVGHPTLRLVRIAIGALALGELQPSEWRHLTPDEIHALRQAAGLSESGFETRRRAAARGAERRASRRVDPSSRH